MASLRTIAKNAFGGEDEIDRILALPLTGLRMELKHAFQKKHFTAAEYRAFVKKLGKIEDISEQKTLADQAIGERQVSSSLDIDLSTPAKQLLWAAALTRMMQLGEEPVARSALWSQLQETLAVRNEMIATGRVIYSSLQNDDTSVSWGQPGTWFYFDPRTNHINLDLYFSLMMGFEHTRCVNLHEIGHSELSNKYSQRMQELYDKIKHVIDPSMIDRDSAPPRKMTKEEQKDLALLVKEWKLRFHLWHMVEDNCVDQFATNMSQSYPQDFGYSKNVIFTALQGFGEIVRGSSEDMRVTSDQPLPLTPEEAEKQERMKKALTLRHRPLDEDELKAIAKGEISPEVAGKVFDEVTTAVLLAFYEHNKLFAKSEDSWRRFRVFPEDIRGAIDLPAAPGEAKKDAFAHLVELAAGPQGINTLQPQPKDRYFGREHYQARVAETTEARIRVMDRIWDLYLDKYAQVLLKDFEKKIEENLDKKKKGQNQQGQNQQGQGQQGEGQPQPGEGQPGEGQQGDSGGDGEPTDMDGDLQEETKGVSETPEDKRQSGREAANDNNGSDNEAGDGQKQDKEAAGGKGWDKDPEADKNKPQHKVGDLRQKEPIDEKLTPQQKEAMKKAAEIMQKPGQGALSMQGGHGRGLDLAKLAKGDWNDFNRRVLELSPIINSVAEALKKIREAQKKQVMKQSRNLDYMAEDGDIQSRLDRDKVLETKSRQAVRAPMKGEDFKKFREDAVHINESTIELYLMIDGSGSMPGVQLGNGATAMEAALQSAAIMYMAARKAGIDAYISMWGDEDPVVIARPDSDLKKVGETLETLRNGTGSGTDLAPGLRKSVFEMSIHKNKHGTISGSSHVLIFSDGDIFDDDKAEAALETMARNGKNLTVDVAVLKPPSESDKTSMEQVVENAAAATHSKMIGVIRGNDANEVPRELARLMLRRVRSIEVKSEPDSNKRRRLKSLHNKMG